MRTTPAAPQQRFEPAVLLDALEEGIILEGEAARLKAGLAGPGLEGNQLAVDRGEDHAVDVRGAARVGTHDRDRAETPGARHRQLDVAQLGQ